MYSDHDFRLHFISQNQPFDIDFRWQEKSSENSVVIGGRNYRLYGDESKILWLKVKLPELSQSTLTIEDLKFRLQSLGVTDISSNQRTQSVAIRLLAEQLSIQEDLELKHLSSTLLDKVTQKVEDRLQQTCPKGAGSMVMVSTLTEGSKIMTAGTCTVDGGKIDGQTAAIIGSGSKMFTALCSLALISQGVVNKKTNQPLSLNTKVADVFSDQQMAIFEDQKKASELTLGMLLSHTSGLVYFADDNKDDRPGMSLSDILNTKEPGSVKFYGQPGDQIYSYSNHIGLVAAMIEIACDKPYAEVLKEMILDPLGMDRTSYDCPRDDNVLLDYQTSPPGTEPAPPRSARSEVKDPMMQGAGGLWSCMDDMAKLGKALGKALKEKSDIIDKNGLVVINRQNLQSMVTSQAINAPCGLALDLEGDVVGKGGGIYSYDFKFKVDTTTGNCISMMCNYAGQGDFDHYLTITTEVLKALNPHISLPISRKPAPQPMSVEELTIQECTRQFKGFSGILAFPSTLPLTRINFNGSTLPVKQLPSKGTDLIDRYIITGDSPFHGKELCIYQKNQHLYPCFVDGMEVWSFAEIQEEPFPLISPLTLSTMFGKAAGDYIDSTPGGPPLHQVRIDPEHGLTLALPEMQPSKCLITDLSETEISFRACLGDGPQCLSFTLMKLNNSEEWCLIVKNGETGDPAGEPLLKNKN